VRSGKGSEKYQRDGDPRTSGPGFGVSEHPDVLFEPLKWRKSKRVFVNSMSDLFHQDVSATFIARVFAVMAITPRHTYQVLTKRHARMRSLLRDETFAAEVAREGHFIANERGLGVSERPSRWPLPNVWLGVSVENQQWADIRIPALLGTPAAVRFISAEPLLGPISLTQAVSVEPYAAYHFQPGGLDWVIVGGESGRGARPMDPRWVRDIRDVCISSGTAFLFKQWGGIRPKSGGRDLDGRTWDEYPGGAYARWVGEPT